MVIQSCRHRNPSFGSHEGPCFHNTGWFFPPVVSGLNPMKTSIKYSYYQLYHVISIINHSIQPLKNLNYSQLSYLGGPILQQTVKLPEATPSTSPVSFFLPVKVPTEQLSSDFDELSRTSTSSSTILTIPVTIN